MRNKSLAGIAVLLIKLGPKLLPIAIKMKAMIVSSVKSLFGVKSAGVAGSVGIYAYLFTWQMGVALVAFIAIHEYGHIWAMHRRGIRTRGMFFIPGFGAVAIADEQFGSAKNEAYIALMGPVFGIVGFVIPAIAAFLYTRDPLFAAIASVTTFINLINLFPINPLDGGRVVKALAYSKRHALSFATSLGISFATAGIAASGGLWLLVYMAIIGFFEIVGEFGISEHLKKLMTTVARVVLASIGVLICLYLATDELSLWSLLFFVFLLLIVACAIADARTSADEVRKPTWYYPLVVLRDALTGIREVGRVRMHDIKPIENYDWMNLSQKGFYMSCFIGLIVVHAAVIIWLASTPEAAIAKELLK